LETGLKKQGVGGDLHIMGSNGGVATARMVLERPIMTVLSGPAAGVLGRAWSGALSLRRHLITFDVGGTSADIGIIRDGTYGEATARDAWVAGYPLMVTIGVTLCKADGTELAVPSKMPYRAASRGDTFIVVGPAGGGYGDPRRREPQRMLSDVLDGFMTWEQACTDYL
jgi:hypothetical protein